MMSQTAKPISTDTAIPRAGARSSRAGSRGFLAASWALSSHRRSSKGHKAPANRGSRASMNVSGIDLNQCECRARIRARSTENSRMRWLRRPHCISSEPGGRCGMAMTRQQEITTDAARSAPWLHVASGPAGDDPVGAVAAAARAAIPQLGQIGAAGSPIPQHDLPHRAAAGARDAGEQFRLHCPATAAVVHAMQDVEE